MLSSEDGGYINLSVRETGVTVQHSKMNVCQFITLQDLWISFFYSNRFVDIHA